MTRIADTSGRELIGYTSRWSAEAGEALDLMVSTTEERFEVTLLRLRHGDPNPAGPGFFASTVEIPIAGLYPGRLQHIDAGSHAEIDDPKAAQTRGVWVWPTRPRCGRRQLLLDGAGITLFINEEGRVGARVGDTQVLAAEPLRAQRWVRVAGSARAGELALAVADTVTSTSGSAGPGAGEIRLADGFDGKLEAPFAFDRPLADHELSDEQLSPDRSWDIRQARLFNAPTLAVTGRLWDDDTTDFRVAPDEYAAVYFHTDDLDDAGWEPTCSLTVPEDLVSGVYAFGLTAGSLTDHVPFVVRPRAGTSSGDIGLLLPTLTYQVYGNERLLDGGETGMAPIPQGEVTLDPADRWLSKHPEAGSSCYDHHADGDGVSLVSLRRPIPNLRPSFVWWITNSPERFGSDLYLVDWLEQRGEPFDVFTDHDLHAAGVALLEQYRVILTGTHPEYYTGSMLDAVRDYLEGGGRLMYLGGNGFYWVTSIDPNRPHIAEVRRGVNGTRAWSSRPGEQRHATTGEQGGLWRYRGRDPNRMVGVGFAAQADAPQRAPGYRRTAESYSATHQWIFDGVDAPLFGAHGLYLGGAAGYEIDRHDPAWGSPEEAIVLASSQGMHPDSYLLVVEDMEATIPDIAGPESDKVRADLTYLPHPSGGAVFSVGSCSWCGSLSTNEYSNDISQITENVLRRFTSD